MTDKAQAGKPGVLRRFYGWGQRRLLHPALAEASHGSVRDAGATALSALKPLSIERDDLSGGYRGRYADGGVARFWEIAKELGLTEENLDVLSTFHRLQCVLNAAAGLAALCLGLGMAFFGTLGVVRLGGVAFLIFALVFLAGFIRHDFADWQIRQRRMAGLSAYLAARFW